MIEQLRKFAPIFEAIVAGKEIQQLNPETKTWEPLSDEKTFDFDKEYRIKPEKKFRRFNYEDREFLKGKWIKIRSNSIQFVSAITGILSTGVLINGKLEVSYSELLTSYTFDDGSVCGVELPEE